MWVVHPGPWTPVSPLIYNSETKQQLQTLDDITTILNQAESRKNSQIATLQAERDAYLEDRNNLDAWIKRIAKQAGGEDFLEERIECLLMCAMRVGEKEVAIAMQERLDMALKERGIDPEKSR